jgi:DnaA family protein
VAFKQIPLFEPRDAFRFDNFFVGPNAEAVAHLKRLVSEIPTRRPVGGGSIFLWGPQGCGKTHLLQALCHYATAHGRSSAFLPLADFADTDTGVLEGLETRHIIAIDSLERISGDALWERALFDLYNRVREKDNNLVMAADNKPEHLGIAMPDLVSRLNWGLVLRIKALKDEDKMRALQLRAERRGFALNTEVCEYLLRRYPRDMHSLFVLLDRLDEASFAAQRKITIPFIKEVM